MISTAPPFLEITETDVCYSVAKLFFATASACADIPMSGRRLHGAAAGPPTPVHSRTVTEAPVTVFYAVPTSTPPSWPAPRRRSALRQNSAAAYPPGSLRRTSASAGSTAYGVDILDGIARPRCCTSSSPTAAGEVKYGTTGKPVRATPASSSMTTGSREARRNG